MVDVPPGANLGSFIENHQGETINVPEATFNETSINVKSGTRLIFNGTTIDPGRGLHANLFNCSGSGWHVGGSCTIAQDGKNFSRLTVSGSGQFGDDTGRIVWRGRVSPSILPGRGSRGGPWNPELRRFLTTLGSGDITIQNVTQLGPPYQQTDYQLHWSRSSCDLTLIGCHFDNRGFYIKTHRGSFTMTDSYMLNPNGAAFRSGCNGGLTVKRTNVVSTGANNPGFGGGTNHSFYATQDDDGQTGSVLIEQCHYVKPGHQSGTFLRDMSTNDGANPAPHTITVRDSQWSTFPDWGRAVMSGPANMNDGGGNGGNPDNFGGPYPFGGGEPGEIPGETPIEDIVNLNGSNAIEFSKSGAVGSYTFETTEGTIEPGQNANLGDGTDTLTNGGTLVNGTTGGGGSDDWTYTGYLTRLERNPVVSVVLNGHSVDGRIPDVLNYYDQFITPGPDPEPDPEPDPDPDPLPSPPPDGSGDGALVLAAFALLSLRKNRR